MNPSPIQFMLYNLISTLQTVLRLRLRRIYLLSFLSTHSLLCLSFFSLLSPLSSLLNFVSPTILSCSLLAWSFSVLPLLVLRKWDIQGKVASSWKLDQSQTSKDQSKTRPLIVRSAKNSPLEYWQSKLSSFLDRNALAHAFSGLVLALTFTLCMSSFQSRDGQVENSDWNFYKPITHQHRFGRATQSTRPNERVFFLLWSNTIFGLIYVLSNSLSLKNNLSSSSTPIFSSSSTSTSLRDRFVSSSSKSFIPSIILSISSSSILLISYLLSRRSLFLGIIQIIGPTSTFRSYLIPDFRLNFLSIELIIRSTLLGISSILIWRICVDCLWEIYSTQPVLVSEFGKDKTRGLIGGLKARSTNKAKKDLNRSGGDKEALFLSNYAFAELSLLTSSSIERRKEIYQDVGISSVTVSGSPISQVLSNGGIGKESAWKSILKECLDVLKDEIESIKSAGKTTENDKADNGQNKSSSSFYPSTPDSNNRQRVSSSPGRNLEVTDPEKLKKAIKNRKPDVWDAISASPKPSNSTSIQPSILTKNVNNLLPKSVTSLMGLNTSTNSKPSETSTTSNSKTSKKSSNKVEFSPLMTLLFTFFSTVYHLLPSDLIHVTSAFFIPIFSFLYQILNTDQSLILKTLIPNPNHQASLIWSIESLTDLSINSLDEDKLGVVQRDLIQIEEIFSDFLLVLDSKLIELLKELKVQEEEEKDLIKKVFKKEIKESDQQKEGIENINGDGDGNGNDSKRKLKFKKDYLNHTLPLIMTLRNGLVLIGNTFDHFDLPGNNDLIREKIEKACGLPIGIDRLRGIE